MSVVVVFRDRADLDLFWEGLPLSNRTVPRGAFAAVVSDAPANYTDKQAQFLCSWKKYYGLAYMMDLRDAPDYGIIADSELLLFDERDCGRGSRWNTLLERIRGLERERAWPAVKINDEDHLMFEMVKGIMRVNHDWVNRGNQSACAAAGCSDVRSYQEDGTFSWWTDIPWVSLEVVKRMLTHVAKREKAPDETWTDFVRPMHFPRYDHIAYQYWTVIHEGFRLTNVTSFTGRTFGMATYTEAENREGSRAAELDPVWIGDRVYEQTLGPTTDQKGRKFGKIQALSPSRPPLLVFHTDKGGRAISEKADGWEARVNASRGAPGPP